ncbi:hypothetical protein A7A08_02670 [Methyloligella halotolerans]|uniref:Uncharacterized protein n=1 Tax=Methyloligella halotolerans TaxID=1177755 RepID=A0A1E2RWA7_9HYPH|nr:hypothetical protein A7A08_02670 [Methyloligella halotolerans]
MTAYTESFQVIVRASLESESMKPFLKDVPFKGSRRVYLAIKLLLLVFIVLVAWHVFYGLV